MAAEYMGAFAGDQVPDAYHAVRRARDQYVSRIRCNCEAPYRAFASFEAELKLAGYQRIDVDIVAIRRGDKAVV